MKKTDRKNKTNLDVTWPKDSIFTINDLHKKNKDFVLITLRVRLKKAIDAGEVMDIGVLHNGKGRPTNVFVYGKPTNKHLEQAKEREVIIKSGLESQMSVTVLSVNKEESTAQSETQLTSVAVEEKDATVAV